MPNIQTNTYKTKDTAEAAVLIIKGHQFQTIEREGRICWFVFANKNNECEQLSNNYYFGEVLVNARIFHEVMSRLKGRIFARE